MFHEGKKGGWFTCILTRLKIQAYLCKNVVNKNTVRKFYVGITLIQKKKKFPYDDKQIITSYIYEK